MTYHGVRRSPSRPRPHPRMDGPQQHRGGRLAVRRPAQPGEPDRRHRPVRRGGRLRPGLGPPDTELLSPSYDFSAERAPELQFDTALPSLYRLGDLTADVDASTDGGATWTTLWHHTDIVPGPAHRRCP
ncbi:hypothetical protein E4K10_34590 [Streptomyces sp. T1317-0309]|nr:hypothetical protein E4K10_34590 [Streptomyces sp. T1317-0309]